MRYTLELSWAIPGSMTILGSRPEKNIAELLAVVGVHVRSWLEPTAMGF